MPNQKLTSDALQQELQRLRDASRSRARRLQLTADLIVFLCLLLFLAMSMFAAKALWDSLHAPVYAALAFAVLAASIQRVLGLSIHRGQFRRPLRYQPLWWTVLLLSGTAMVLLAG